MGLHETEELDLDLILYGDPGNDSSDSDELICRCGHGRGRGVVRTVPRLPQAAILHRISLMESDTSGLVEESMIELRDSSSSATSSRTRRGRGRARILRDNATATLPTVGRSKMKEEVVPPIPQNCEEPRKQELVEVLPILSGNWLHDEFPTLTAASQDTDSDSSSKATRKVRRKPHFREIRAKIDKLRPELQNDVKSASAFSKEVEEEQKLTETKIVQEPNEKRDETFTPAATHDTEIIDTYNITNITKAEHRNNGLDVSERSNNIEEPKINKRNFMKQSKIEFKKLLPEGMSYGNRKDNLNHNHSLRMNRFVFDDDKVPEYLKYEVTHDDIRRHNKKVTKVPDTVKGRVNDWLSKMDPVDDAVQTETKKFEGSGETDVRTSSGFAETLKPEESHKLSQNLTKNNPLNIIRPKNGSKGIETKSDRDISYINNEDSERFNSSVIVDNNVDFNKPEYEESKVVTTNTGGSSNAAAGLYMNNENLDDSLVKEINSVDMKKFENSQWNNLNVDTDNYNNISPDASQVNTSNIYMSDDESNEILESARALDESHTNFEQSSNISTDSNKACVSESDFVIKYQTVNDKKTKKGKSNFKTSAQATEKSANSWRLDGERVIQFDGLPANCVTSSLEEMISSFGTVSDCERKVFGDRLAIRFKLHDEDACDFAVQCLHDTDCLFPDSNSALECYKVG